MKSFHVQIARGVFQNAANNVYSETAEITSFDDLKAAAAFDHVGAVYQNGKRSIENFLWCDCLIMDVDNDGTENKEAWINSPKLKKIFPDVQCYIIFSRHHEAQKKSYSPRPRFHVYFPLSQQINNPEQLRALKESLLKICPAFDSGAKDAARFFFGVEEPKGLPVYGSKCIDDFLANYEPENLEPELEDGYYDNFDFEVPPHDDDDVIKEGGRNNTLFNTAFKALMKYDIEQAQGIFREACGKCMPPLSDKEIRIIWNSAAKTAKIRKEQDGDKRRDKFLCSNDVSRVLKNFGIQIRFNIITGRAEVSGLPLNSPFISDDFKNLTPDEQVERAPAELEIFLKAFLKHKNYKFTAEFLTQILAALFSYHEFNPVLEMLESVKWDGEDRISKLAKILNITEPHYYTMLKKWLIQAVAITQNKGQNSNDFVLTLQGKQGLGKTEFFRVLTMRSDWFYSGAVIDMRDKDSRIEATNCWICEIGELDSTLKKEQTSLKAFITNTHDTYRRPYAAMFERRPRRTTFCASVNDERFLRDTTGNRRWVVIHVDKIDLKTLYTLTRDWLIQLWRQAYELYLNGEPFRLTVAERERNEMENQGAMVLLPAEQEIIESLDWDVDESVWTDYTATDLKREISGLKNTDSGRIGRVLNKMATDDPRIMKFIKHKGKIIYRLPPVKGTSFYGN